MIEKTQRRFIQISMASFTIVMLALFLSINGLNIWQNISHVTNQVELVKNQSEQELQPVTPPQEEEPIAENPPFSWNVFSRANNPEARFMVRYFSVTLEDEEQITEMDLEHIYAINEDTATEYTQEVIETGKEQGWVSRYRYQLTTNNSGENIIYFVDGTREITNIIEVAAITAIVFILSMIIVYGLLIYFSKIAISPLIKNIERQKEFIHNASHELKTPLTILSTNNDIIEMEHASNEWTTSNRTQIKRLNKLIEQMLLLARFDEGRDGIELQYIETLPLVNKVIQNLNQLIINNEVDIQVNIPQNFKQTVEPEMFSQLLEILLDNAIKYHDPTEPINIHTEHNQLIVANKAKNISAEQANQLFDRFYRVETSNEEQISGSGMGLSIAKGIAKTNKIKLTADLQNDRISFKLHW